jgi:hypothetical protein
MSDTEKLNTIRLALRAYQSSRLSYAELVLVLKFIEEILK